MWRQVCSELSRLGTLKLVDRGVLAAYCSAWATFRAAEEKLNDGRGLTQQSRHGEAPRPEIKIAREAKQQIRALGVELGLTPKSRGYQSGEGAAKQKEPEDPIEKALGTRLRRN